MPNYKHSRKQSRRKNFVALPVTGQVALLTLADNTVVAANLHTGNFTEDFYAISADLEVSVRGLTSGEGPPASWGLSHSDYNVTEIKENLEVSLLGRGSKIEQERTRRLVRNGGQMFKLVVGDARMLPNDEAQRRVPLRFMIQEGFALNIWLMNRSASAYTTGAILEWFGTVYGRWVT